jgi:DNA polymerase III delta prime subunit
MIQSYLNTIQNTAMHGFVLVGDRAQILLELTAHFRSTAELQVIDKKTLQIEDIRDIKQAQYTKTSTLRLLILSSFSFGHEAQNALLKLLEEPSANTKVLLLTEDESNLLDTIHSRTITLHCKKTDSIDKTIEKIAQTLRSERSNLTSIKKILNQKDVDDTQDKEIMHQTAIKLCEYVSGRINMDSISNDDAKSLRAALDSLSKFKQNGISGKILLEHILLRLPEVK